MFELVYAGKDIEDIVRGQYPDAIIEDASDEVHPQRFEVETATTTEEFWVFAIKKGFALACFGFQLMLQDPSQRDATRRLIEAATKEEETNVRYIKQSDIGKCPHFIMVASHYREDGSCKCDDPDEQAMMIREWGYKRKDFREVGK